MTGSLRFRLSALMFLQYAVLGLWVVTLPTFLRASPHEGGLNLTGQQIGWLYATIALAAAVAPLIAGLLADTLFATQKVLAILHFVGAILLVLTFRTCVEHQGEMDLTFRKLAFVEPAGDGELWHRLWEKESIEAYLRAPDADLGPAVNYPAPIVRFMNWLGLGRTPFGNTSFPRRWRSLEEANYRFDELKTVIDPALVRVRQHSNLIADRDRAFQALFWLLLAYNLCYLPSVTLVNALCLRNMRFPERQFGSARVFGTVGWIVALILVGLSLPAISAATLLLAAMTSLVLAGFCLALPHTPPLARPKSLGDWLGLPALRMAADRSFFVFLLTALACSVLIAFHNIFTNPFLVDLHLGHAAAFQAIGQTSEVVGILLIPWLSGRLGMRWLLTLGLFCSAGRFLGYATGSIPLVIGFGLLMHGLGFSLFYVTASIYVDTRAPSDLRASAQGLVTQVTSGLGALLGTCMSGWVVDGATRTGTVDWRTVWLVPALGTLLIAVVFAALFRDAPRQTKMEIKNGN
jgi:nucleoside transporter